jgi:anti-sigma factor RsiW
MHAMDCTALDDQLADYLEGELPRAERRQVDVHLASCARCAALVRDLERIRSEAGELPELAPSADLWSGIARRIDTPVVSFDSRTTPNVATRRRSSTSRLRTVAVAAALVAVTAGVTYMLTVSRGAGGSNPAGVASTARPSPDTTVATPDQARPETVPTSRDLASTDTASPSVDRTEGGSSAATQVARNTPASVTYSREIDRLRTIFLRSRSQLDPRTAAIIEANLKVIDDAIAQSKAALANDPASRFLTDQLNSALDKKLELLRTAALLPNRT